MLKRTTIRMEPELVALLKKLRKQTNQSAQYHINRAVRQYLKRRKML